MNTTAGWPAHAVGPAVSATHLVTEVTDGREAQAATRLPVLDGGAFRVLAEQVGVPVAKKFLEDYVNLLPLRSAAVFEGLDSEDMEKALDALISLKVSSAIAGASQMEDSARELQHRVQAGRWPEAATVRILLTNQVFQVMGAAKFGPRDEI